VGEFFDALRAAVGDAARTELLKTASASGAAGGSGTSGDEVGLSPEQEAAIRAAVEHGYYESPREVDVGELAATSTCRDRRSPTDSAGPRSVSRRRTWSTSGLSTPRRPRNEAAGIGVAGGVPICRCWNIPTKAYRDTTPFSVMRDGSNGSEETAGSETTGGAAGADGRRRELTVSLAVPEMDCPSCAGKVDNAIGRLDGVTNAALNPTAGTATVTYDPMSSMMKTTWSQPSRAPATRSRAGGRAATRAATTPREAPTPTRNPAGRRRAPAEVWTTAREEDVAWRGTRNARTSVRVHSDRTEPRSRVCSASRSRSPTLCSSARSRRAGSPSSGGYYSARNRSLDIDLLMGTAIIAATGIGYFVEAATLAVLFSIAELLEDYAMDRARDSCAS